MKKFSSLFIPALIFLVGTAILMYPSFSNWLYEQRATKYIASYGQLVDQHSPDDKEAQLRRAREYNEALTGYNIEDPFIPGSGVVLPDNYTSVLNFGGMMGYITIPKVQVHLPIRHGTSEDVLRYGAGHIEATAFPIGGEGNHAVITGHRGLPEAKLFTDLGKLDIGDVFQIHILQDTLVYQVDQILTVEPADVDALRPVPGKDYITLVTCTPYAINSHRLLIRGERIPYVLEEMPPEILEKLETPQYNPIGLIIAAFAVSWILFAIVYRRKKSKRIKRK